MHIPAFVLPISPYGWRNGEIHRTLYPDEKRRGEPEHEPQSRLLTADRKN